MSSPLPNSSVAPEAAENPAASVPPPEKFSVPKFAATVPPVLLLKTTATVLDRQSTLLNSRSHLNLVFPLLLLKKILLPKQGAPLSKAQIARDCFVTTPPSTIATAPV